MLRVWRRLLGLCTASVLEDVELDEDAGVVVAYVRPKSRWKRRCARCGWRSPGYDTGVGRRRWRSQDRRAARGAWHGSRPLSAALPGDGVCVADRHLPSLSPGPPRRRSGRSSEGGFEGGRRIWPNLTLGS